MKLSLTCVVSFCGHVFQVELSARLAVSASESCAGAAADAGPARRSSLRSGQAKCR